MAFANIAIAKVNISIQELMGTWKVINPTYNDLIETFDFTKTSMSYTRQYSYNSKAETYTNKSQYYLSTGIPAKYNSTLVGKAKSGTHIIYYVQKKKLIKHYEIVSLKDNTLTISYYAPRAIGRNAGTVTLTLKRVVSCNTGKTGNLVTLQQLQGKWQRTEDIYKVDTQTWTFQKASFIVENKYVYRDKIDNSKYEIFYYLSKGVPNVYDGSKVGKIGSGTHIIYYAKPRKKILSYKIVSLKGDTLTLSQYAPRAIGRNAGIVTITLKRVSR